MSKNLSTLGACLVLAGGGLFAQTAAAPLSFEVASIKEAPQVTPQMVMSGKLHVGMKIDAARVDIGMLSLQQLICKAYEVKPYQVSGPAWIDNARFDIIAKMPEGATKEQVPQMLQTLLKDRFHLEIHRDKKDQSVYALVVGKGGLKLKEADPDPVKPEVTAEGGGPAPAPSTGSSQMEIKTTASGAVVSDGQGRQQRMTMAPDGKSMRFEISRATMDELAEGLAPFTDKPIVNQTGLTGKYQVTLDVSMADIMALARARGMMPGAGPAPSSGGGDSARPADAASDPTSGSVFTALQNLGLKLEPKKAPLDLIVVDKIDKTPTEN